jgi:glycosyl transferase family 4
MRPLSILLTNNTLAERAGTELWVRDVARSLVARGHRPAAFSLVPGQVADDLRRATVPVVSDLSNYTGTPDLIHGHHHVETLIAALHFPGVPIVHFCHGWLPWEERPLKHPAIARYVAVDETCADRLIAEEGIPEARVERLLNFVDLERFTPREPLPARPTRVLVFSNQATDVGFAAVIAQACREAHLDVEIVGRSSGRIVDRPELVLKKFDLVFAKARSALEAMAVGCSVILADVAGAGPMTTTADFERMRAANFGVRLLNRPHSVDWYRQQIARYDASEAASVSARVRREAGLEIAVDQLLAIYERALAEGASVRRRPDECLTSQRAAARHLASIAQELKNVHAVAVRAEELARELATERAQLIAAKAENNAAAVQAALRLRAAVVRVPIVGSAARHIARWLR